MSFTTRQLMIFTAGAAVALAGLAYPDPIIGDIFYTGALLLIAYATIAAIYCRGSQRAYWVGFVILFAGYFCHTVWPTEIRSAYNGLRLNNQFGYGAQDLVSTRLFNFMFEGIHGSPLPGRTGPYAQPMGSRSTPGVTTMSEYVTFLTVGQTSIALLLGMIGGSIARRFSLQSINQLKRSIEGLPDDVRL